MIERQIDDNLRRLFHDDLERGLPRRLGRLVDLLRDAPGPGRPPPAHERRATGFQPEANRAQGTRPASAGRSDRADPHR
ncbi:hypothetical protein [Meridianimarinicoccus roseus]|uniref:hypothetical protein n=1 Tax=Meridianimarinicoccus roseus TaxID=2072018 RepID=UPI001EE68569|nr:hypothetical protein [Meridianimarinicoccus roseus]